MRRENALGYGHIIRAQPIEPGVKSAENVKLLRPFSGALANLK
jgi:hypothetical protein